jgi:O-antigen ligase
MSVPESILRRQVHPALQRVGDAAVWVWVGLASAGLGLVLAFLAAPFEEASPFVLIGIPLVPLLVAAVIADPIVAPLIVIATLPLGAVGAGVGPISLQASEGAALAVGMLIVVRRLALGQAPLPFRRELIWPVLLLGWTLVALYTAIDEGLALKQLIALLGGILLACTVLAACRDMHRLRILLGALTVTGLIIALTSLSGNHQLQAAGGGTTVSNRLEGAFQSPNQLGSWCALVIPIAAGLMFAYTRRSVRLLGAVTVLALLATLMFSLSRGAWIGTGAATLFLIITLREARRLLVFLLVPLVLIGYVTFSFAPAPPDVEVVGERFQAIGARSPYDARSQIYNEALREIKENPVTGVGPGGFILSSRRAGTATSTVAADHAHNMFLNYGAEMGLPAVAILLGFIIALGSSVRRASRAVKRVDWRHRSLLLCIAAGLIAILVQGFVDYTLGNPVIRITVWLLIGALLVAVREAERLPPSRR